MVIPFLFVYQYRLKIRTYTVSKITPRRLKPAAHRAPAVISVTRTCVCVCVCRVIYVYAVLFTCRIVLHSVSIYNDTTTSMYNDYHYKLVYYNYIDIIDRIV